MLLFYHQRTKHLATANTLSGIYQVFISHYNVLEYISMLAITYFNIMHNIYIITLRERMEGFVGLPLFLHGLLAFRLFTLAWRFLWLEYSFYHTTHTILTVLTLSQSIENYCLVQISVIFLALKCLLLLE